MPLRVGEVMCVEVGCGVWGSAPVVQGVCEARKVLRTSGELLVECC